MYPLYPPANSIYINVPIFALTLFSANQIIIIAVTFRNITNPKFIWNQHISHTGLFSNKHQLLYKLLQIDRRKSQRVLMQPTNNSATRHLPSIQESRLFVFPLKFKKLLLNGINYRKWEINEWWSKIRLSIIPSIT